MVKLFTFVSVLLVSGVLMAGDKKLVQKKEPVQKSPVQKVVAKDAAQTLAQVRLFRGFFARRIGRGLVGRGSARCGLFGCD